MCELIAQNTVQDVLSLDEAIRHATEVADNCADVKCRCEHYQLAAWLSELKEWRNSNNT